MGIAITTHELPRSWSPSARRWEVRRDGLHVATVRFCTLDGVWQVVEPSTSQYPGSPSSFRTSREALCWAVTRVTLQTPNGIC
jgi:hypothetical protein